MTASTAKLICVLTTALLSISLFSCDSTKPTVTESEVTMVFSVEATEKTVEYTKISPQEAEQIMNEDVIILDVRTQEEFDGGHIINAILLPDYEVAEKADSILTDKNQMILIYCRTGRRSEISAKELIEMGYTNVYDFGGIVDWIGEIVWEASDTIFYNYFGGELPADVITPIDYSITQLINDEVGELEIRIEGTNTKEYGLNHDKSRYYIEYDMNEITKLTVLHKDGSVLQEFSDLYTESSTGFWRDYGKYGLSFNDWNFDGYMDISLFQFKGGSMLNMPLIIGCGMIQ